MTMKSSWLTLAAISLLALGCGRYASPERHPEDYRPPTVATSGDEEDLKQRQEERARRLEDQIESGWELD